MADSPVLTGILHIFVAFDWGDEIILDQAAQLVGAARHEFPRRRRTPTSFSYRPAPLRLPLEPIPVQLDGLEKTAAAAELTLFDFAAVSLALQVPFSLERERLLALAASLADPSALQRAARNVLEPLHRQLIAAIVDPAWTDDLSEEYFVFQLAPHSLDPECDAALLGGLVHLESGPISAQEIQEALKLRLSYSPDDLFLPDWAAAVLIDKECEETLEAIEFANLQLLEFRHIDTRLDDRLAAASRTIAPLKRRPLAFWRSHARPLRALGELKVEANALFERTENVLKLVGDPYLARVYRLLAQRFHLQTWEENIRRKLEVIEGVYQVVADQASHFRTEFLEIVVVLLILIEIVLALVRH
ncbi:MAG: hypothetical protein HY040_03345 [Planctomycetes bacterium]|nr:hypothetical protein [Planctomycetota bacterium]